MRRGLRRSRRLSMLSLKDRTSLHQPAPCCPLSKSIPEDSPPKFSDADLKHEGNNCGKDSLDRNESEKLTVSFTVVSGSTSTDIPQSSEDKGRNISVSSYENTQHSQPRIRRSPRREHVSNRYRDSLVPIPTIPTTSPKITQPHHIDAQNDRNAHPGIPTPRQSSHLSPTDKSFLADKVPFQETSCTVSNISSPSTRAETSSVTCKEQQNIRINSGGGMIAVNDVTAIENENITRRKKQSKSATSCAFSNFSSPSNRAEISAVSSKQKRKRRSTLGGGLITLNDITNIENESTARKQRKSRGITSDKSDCRTFYEKERKSMATNEFQVKTAIGSKLTSNRTNESSQPALIFQNHEVECRHSDEKLARVKTYPNCIDIQENALIHPLRAKNTLQVVDNEADTRLSKIREGNRDDFCNEGNIISISAKEITACAARLFSRDGVVEKPCMSARIFASLYLIVGRQKSAELNIEDASNSFFANPLQPILPLLETLVYAELTSLGDAKINKGSNMKRLHFCSFNYSTISTSVDITVGSNKMTEDCITSLYNVVQQIEKLRLNLCSQEKIDDMMSLVSNLDFFERGEGKIIQECSKTMPFHWPIERFVKASRHYRNEIGTAILGSLTTNDYSPLKKRLGDLIGSAIRFYLRQFFNPIPYPPSSTDIHSSKIEGTKIRSRVHLIVAMKEESNNICTAAADGSISSVFGLALRSIYEFFELNEHKEKNKKCYNHFCQRTASIASRGTTIKLNQDDLDEILLDIEEAHVVLSGIRARKFVRELLNWPGVSEAISDKGGWKNVEYFAKMYVECSLHYVSCDEKYLALLKDVKQLIQQLHDDAKELEDVENICVDSLRKLWRRFKCGTKNPNVLRNNPFIKNIKEHLEAERQTRFPSLVPVSSME